MGVSFVVVCSSCLYFFKKVAGRHCCNQNCENDPVGSIHAGLGIRMARDIYLALDALLANHPGERVRAAAGGCAHGGAMPAACASAACGVIKQAGLLCKLQAPDPPTT